MSSSKPTPRLIYLAVLCLLIAACTPVASSAPAQAAVTKTSVQLSWSHNIEFASLYMAQDKGYFANEKLDVDIKVGGLDAQKNAIDPIQQVTSGKADFGLISSMDLLKAREKGAPIVAFAAQYQRDPTAFASLAAKNIRRPQDLVGKTVQVGYSGMAPFQAMLHAVGVDPSTIKLVTRTDYTIAPLASGQADVMDVWVINEAVDLTSHGYTINLILPSDYGVEIYSGVFFTTEDMINKNPDLVRRFLRATLHGLRSSMDDPAGSAKLAVAYDKTLDLKMQTLAMQQSLPLIATSGSQPGMMEPKVWQITQQIMLDQGLLAKSVELDKAYNLTFVNEIYPSK